MASEIKLGALKENLESVEVDQVNVAEGDVVAKDQVLMTVQADKAALDVTAPVGGRVSKLLVKNGDQLKVGQTYIFIDEESNGAPAEAPKAEAPKAEEPKPAAPKAETTAAEQHPQTTAGRPAVAPTPATAPPPSGTVVPAGPATRRMARELGVALQQVRGSGRNGRVTEEDVKAYVRQLAAGGGTAAAGAPVAAPPLPRFEDWGPVEQQKLDPIRKATAKQMALAWSLIPHVTQHDLADITELDAFRRQQDGKGPKLTVTAFALKACAIALKQFPTFNSSLDLANNQLILKKYVHIGIAVDTEYGLLVPVIRDVDHKSVTELADEMNQIAERARKRQVQMEEMKGGTFTVTNLGGIGGTGFTPIVNYPEVAILGMSRARLEPVIRNGQVVPRLMMPLSLSYDHRVIDGAAAARFTRRLAEMLENPMQMVLHA